MIFAPPMWRKAGRGAARARVSPRARRRGGFLEPVAFINIGGVANLSFIAPGKEPIACDTGPGKGLLDDLMLKRRGVPFDRDGATASRGKADGAVLSALLAHPYFATAEIARPQRFLGQCRRESRDRRRGGDAHRLHRGQRRLRAAAVAVAPLVCDCLRRRRAQKNLGAGIGDRLPCPVLLAETFGWSSDAMEAHAFAYLAARREKNLPITFPMTTGVDEPLEGGVIAEPGVA
jgi:anhydro-N-acetylmuramic acid kinase